jgi:hypothetical protein
MTIVDDRSSAGRAPPPFVERLARWLSASFFLGGLAAGFGLCCTLGYLTAGSVTYQPFVRFHQLINPESFFQPTVLQVRRMVLDAPASKILVVVGGSSRMNGAGQAAAGIWTGVLQEMLGRRYHVINLAMRAGFWDQFGMYAVEMAIRAERKVIYVADPFGSIPVIPFGRAPIYHYFFFDARARGLLLAWEPRDRALSSYRSSLGEFDELSLRGSLDSLLQFTDLWTKVGYDYVFLSAWSVPTRDAPFRARRYAPDNTVVIPYQYPTELEMRSVRQTLVGYEASLAAGDLGFEIVPREVRRRTVLVGIPFSPFYVQRLSETEQQRLRVAEDRGLALAAAAGITIVGEGDGWTADDFTDSRHPSERGGERLAAEVAPVVRQLAARLGYLP